MWFRIFLNNDPDFFQFLQAVRRAILDEQSGIARASAPASKYAYDNDAMNYNYHM